MTTNLAMVSGVIGSICLLTVCIVYLWKQRFALGGAMLAICGVALLGMSYWQAASRPTSQEQAVSDLSRQLGKIDGALRGLEGQIEQIIENHARLSAAVGAFKEEHDAALAAVQAGSRAPRDALAAGEPVASAARAIVSNVLEIEVIGGVSEEELAAIVAWIEDVKSENRLSQIFVEPVMPQQSTDLEGQRKRLMSEAGRVMDHVYDEIHQRMEISNLVSEDVPGPRLRLGFSGA